MAETRTTKIIYEADEKSLLQAIQRLNKGLDQQNKLVEEAAEEKKNLAKIQNSLSQRTRRLGRELRIGAQGFAQVSKQAGTSARFLGGMLNTVSTAGGMFGPVGVAAVVFSTGILAVGTAAIKAAGALIDLAAEGRELAEAMEDTPGFINEEDIDSVVQLDDEMESLILAVKAMGVAILNDLQPVLSKILVNFVALAFQIRDNTEQFYLLIEGSGAFLSALMKVQMAIAKPMTMGAIAGDLKEDVLTLRDTARAFEELSSTQEQYRDEAQKAIDAFTEFADSESKAAKASKKAAADRLAALEAFRRKQEQILRNQERIEEELTKELETPMERIEREYLTLKERILEAGYSSEKLTEILDMAHKKYVKDKEEEIAKQDEQIEKEKEAREAKEAALREQEAAARQVFSSIAQFSRTASTQLIQDGVASGKSFKEMLTEMREGMEDLGMKQRQIFGASAALYANQGALVADQFSEVALSFSALGEALGRDSLKQRRRQARLGKAAGIASATVSTFEAVGKAMASAPPPLSFVLAGLALTAGVANIAAIKATPLPQEHIGSGLLGAKNPLASDELVYNGKRQLRQEMITSSGTVNSTGAQMVNDLNTGRLNGNQASEMVAVIGRSHLDRELGRSGRSGTSRHAKQLRKNPHPKQNRGY